MPCRYRKLHQQPRSFRLHCNFNSTIGCSSLCRNSPDDIVVHSSTLSDTASVSIVVEPTNQWKGLFCLNRRCSLATTRFTIFVKRCSASDLVLVGPLTISTTEVGTRCTNIGTIGVTLRYSRFEIVRTRINLAKRHTRSNN